MRNQRWLVGVYGYTLLLLVIAPASGNDPTGDVFIPNSFDDPNIYSVSLPGLDDSGYLSGEVVSVSHGWTDWVDRAFSDDQTFAYDPDASTESRIHFSETMAYYHITSFWYYVRNLGVEGIDTRITATVYSTEEFGGGIKLAETRYIPDPPTISLGYLPSGGGSDALDGDVIVHETVHALQHQLAGGAPTWSVSVQTTESEQASSLIEAHADYHAASYFGDAEVGEYLAVTHDYGAFLRKVDNSLRWPEDFAEDNTYQTGMIFSGALWDLRSAVGAEVSDTLALEGIKTVLNSDNNPSTPELNATFADALDAIRQADVDMYGGAHDDQIRQAFAVHGIGAYDFSTPLPMVHNPGNEYDGTEVYSMAGAEALAVTFDEFVTKLDDSPFTVDMFPYLGVDEKITVDYLEILDGNGVVMGTYTGRQLQGATIVVPGDTVQFHLVTDSYLAPFGYRVVDITPIGSGDVNGDGNVDNLDITAFVVALGAADEEEFLSMYPDGDFWAADCDWDGNIDNLDITPFVDMLFGGGRAIPEPATLTLLALGGLALIFKWRRR